MRSIATIRRYELFIILAAATAYVTRRLFELAKSFDFNIERVQQASVSNAAILRDLASFNYNQNVIFPTVAGAVLFMGAWYVFHYHALPRTIQKKYRSRTNWLIVLTIGLVLGSLLMYEFFFWQAQPRTDSQGRYIGFTVYRDSWSELPIATIGALLTLIVYEAITQLYYQTVTLYRRTKKTWYLSLQYVLLIISGIIILFATFKGEIAFLVMNTGGGPVISLLIFMVLTCLFHRLFYFKILPYYETIQLDTINGKLYLIAGIGICVIISYYLFFISIFLFHSKDTFLFIYVLPLSLGFLSGTVRRSYDSKTQQLQTQVLQKTTELDTLRSQVNPHFLFNALNTLYAVALKESSEKTADGIQKLGDMMRFMLHENNQERIPLRKEIEYLHNFLDLQRMRLDAGHAIEIRTNIQEPEHERYLAPMLLNPFVENAFKHGISLREPSWIFITMTLDSTKLYFKVHNSLHHNTGDDPEKNASGIGLENVRKRLNLLYRGRYTLDIQATERDYFISLILEVQ